MHVFWETSFRESDYPGNVFSGKRLSWKHISRKVIIRETSVNHCSCLMLQFGIESRVAPYTAADRPVVRSRPEQVLYVFVSQSVILSRNFLSLCSLE